MSDSWNVPSRICLCNTIPPGTQKKPLFPSPTDTQWINVITINTIYLHTKLFPPPHNLSLAIFPHMYYTLYVLQMPQALQ